MKVDEFEDALAAYAEYAHRHDEEIQDFACEVARLFDERGNSPGVRVVAAVQLAAGMLHSVGFTAEDASRVAAHAVRDLVEQMRSQRPIH